MCFSLIPSLSRSHSPDIVSLLLPSYSSYTVTTSLVDPSTAAVMAVDLALAEVAEMQDMATKRTTVTIGQSSVRPVE